MRKKVLLIIPLIILALVLVGITYSSFRWTNGNGVDVAFQINNFGDVTYNGGADILGVNMIPASSKEKAEADGIGIGKTISVSTTRTDPTYLTLNLNLEVFPEGLAHQSLVWEIYEGNTKLNYGNFADAVQGDKIVLLDNYLVSSTTKTFKLYIWEDGLQDNSPGMYNKHFKFVLNAMAVDEMLADKIIKLAGNCTSWSSGFSGVCATSSYSDNGVTKYHDYRYVGANVNNWVKFDNEDYRIIGVFDDYSHGVSGKKLVKLISADQLFASSWGVYNDTTNYTTYSNYNGNWNKPSNLNVLLNTYYMNSSDISLYGTCENLTYFDSSNSYKTLDCSKIKRYGIKTTKTRDYIQPATWYLKGYSSYSYSKQNFYTCERSDSTSISSCNKSSVTGAVTKIENTSVGLMYVSDYLYASGYFSSSDTTTASSSYYGQQNWLYDGFEWTITPMGGNSYNVFNVTTTGNLNYVSVYNSRGVRATFYLKYNTRVLSGNGTYNNPYKIL